MLRLSFAVLAAGTALPALAADPAGMGYVHLGGSYVRQADDATLYMAGTPVAGAGFETQPGYTVSLEGGLFLRDGFAVAASAMWPTTTSNVGTGTISGLGNLGDETVGFYSATAQYHAAVTEQVSLYGGVGLGYMHVFDTVDGAVTDMNVASAFGAVVQAGIDFKVTDTIGVFADVKRYFISTTASGTLGGTAITADARVDPWVVSSGIGVGF